MFVGEHFGVQFTDGFIAKQSMATRRDMLEYQHPALHDPRAPPAYGDSPYTPQVYMEHGYANEQGQDYYSVQQHAMYLDEKHVASSVPQSRRPSAVASFDGSVQSSEPERALALPMKRKASDDVSNYDVAPPQKRVASAQLHLQNPAIYDNSGQTSPYSQYVATPMSTGSFQHGLAPGARMGHNYSTSNASQVSLAAPSPHTPGWSPSFATVKTEPSPPAPMTPVPRPASSSPVKSSAPRLVRTSTMQQGSPVNTNNFHPIHTGNFNPYAMYPLKASLKLRGDLDSMTKNWTEEEISDRRRLVEFKRSQDGSSINADFSPVAPKDRLPSSITISCILWKEKKEYFVTSVDTIYLLEALVGVRFTVEEKNRIRRNLEGFRPATVSKSKQDSEEFFKVIMGFPHPKPRNIEKDVKVFPWKILAHALKKIISKYSASYSSTASAIMTPLPSSYGEGMGDMTYPPSPPPSYASQYVYDQAQYPPGMVPGRMSAPVTTAPLPELQLQMPTSGPGYDMVDPYNFAAMPGMPQASMLMTSDAMTAPIRAPSWDYNQFVNESPVTSAPHSAPPGVWARPQIETADFPQEHYQFR